MKDDKYHLTSPATPNTENLINNVAEEYNVYYESGENSVYDTRFGKRKFTCRERSLVKNSFRNVLKKLSYQIKNNTNFKFRILDFGCGNGRFFKILEELAFKNPLIKIELLAYDPCRVALENYSQALIAQQYVKESCNEMNLYNNFFGSILGVYKKLNLEVKLINSNIQNSSEDIIQNIGVQSINLIICMFAVLCHIPKRNNRQNILNAFSQLLDDKGQAIINVSTIKSIYKEVLVYEYLRKQAQVFSKYDESDYRNNFLKLATEPGDLYFYVDNNRKCAHIYGHVYSALELKEDIIFSGLKLKKCGILSYKQPYDLSRNKFIDMLDSFFSFISSLNMFSIKLLEKHSKNIYAIASKNNG